MGIIVFLNKTAQAHELLGSTSKDLHLRLGRQTDRQTAERQTDRQTAERQTDGVLSGLFSFPVSIVVMIRFARLVVLRWAWIHNIMRSRYKAAYLWPPPSPQGFLMNRKRTNGILLMMLLLYVARILCGRELLRLPWI